MNWSEQKEELIQRVATRLVRHPAEVRQFLDTLEAVVQEMQPEPAAPEYTTSELPRYDDADFELRAAQYAAEFEPSAEPVAVSESPAAAEQVTVSGSAVFAEDVNDTDAEPRGEPAPATEQDSK